jgi:hypothetical protein
MDPDLGGALPSIVRNYVAARRRWVVVAYDEAARGDASWGEYARASGAMRAALAARGGRWAIGGIVYTLDPAGRGIAIAQAGGDEEAEQLARIRADLAEMQGRRLKGRGSLTDAGISDAPRVSRAE